MAPLVPDLINDQMNLVIALLIGISFGFVLEQAGFSSSRKLTGLFYGTDFTVLRVFFTAGVTAMSGVLLLTQLGWLDADLIYVNPTFIHSAIVGGVIMGIGFVLGGYCPGTSFCAAAVGRVDAMAFVGGGLLGIFAFGEAFPAFEQLYKAGSKGDLLISSVLGVSNGQFAAGMIVMAVAVFMFTTRLEKKINPESGAREFPFQWHRAGAAILIAAAVVLAAVPDRKARLEAKAAEESRLQRDPVRKMAADELAIHLLNGDHKIQILDVRDANDFAKGSLPGAVNVSHAAILGKEGRNVISDGRTLKVFLGGDTDGGLKAAALAGMNGYENLAVLDGGYQGFVAAILDPQPPGARADTEIAVFRARARVELATLIRAQSAPKAPKPIKRVQGGCGG